MHLYEKKNNCIGVYDFSAPKDVLEKYRITEMEKIPENERVLSAINHVASTFQRPYFETYDDEDFNNLIFDYVEADNDASVGRDYNERQVLVEQLYNLKYLLSSYYSGKLKDKPAIRIRYPYETKYYILTKILYDSAGYSNTGCYYKLEDIIQIPQTLFNLQLIENGSYYLLQNKDVKEQLDIFSLKHINDINLDELSKMKSLGMKCEDENAMLRKAENDSHILKLIRK